MLPILADTPRRIQSLDFLRGGALLGILLVNIESFALPFDARLNPTLYGDFSHLNFFAWAFTYLIADEIFVTIFSLLFGAGILLQSRSAENKNLSPASVHYKRMAILLLLGLAHAYLLWYGDILFSYALCGILLFPLRTLSAKTLFALGLLLIAGHTLFAFSLTHNFAPTQSILDVYLQQRGALDIPAEIAAYRGNWLDQMRFRAPTALAGQSTIFFMWTLWRCGGCMLLGMALHKFNFFQPTPPRARKNRHFLAAALLIPLGTALTFLSMHLALANNFSGDVVAFASPQLHYWGSLIAALGYACLLIPLASFATAPLLAIGRTALSNYILQTLLCTTLFYGNGFGYFAALPRAQLLTVVIAIWIFQVLLTTLYLRRFSQGPLEYLWHRLVYPRPQKFP